MDYIKLASLVVTLIAIVQTIRVMYYKDKARKNGKFYTYLAKKLPINEQVRLMKIYENDQEP